MTPKEQIAEKLGWKQSTINPKKWQRKPKGHNEYLPDWQNDMNAVFRDIMPALTNENMILDKITFHPPEKHRDDWMVWIHAFVGIAERGMGGTPDQALFSAVCEVLGVESEKNT